MKRLVVTIEGPEGAQIVVIRNEEHRLITVKDFHPEIETASQAIAEAIMKAEAIVRGEYISTMEE